MKKHVKLKILTFVSLFFFCSVISSVAQEKSITVNVKNASLKDVFNVIEKQTSYRFSYRDALVDSLKNITISKKNATVSAVLDEALTGRNLIYNIVSPKSIVISDKQASENSKEKGTIGKYAGTVIDNTGEPIIGASVALKGGRTGTVTDVGGQFSIEAPVGSTLLVSYIGFAAQEIPLGKKTFIQITLSKTEKQLSEVVVTALGIKREEKALGYAVQKVSGSTLQTVKGVDMATSLSGKVAGMIVRNSTDFMNAPSIQIRGESPLVVIDGVPYGNVSLREIPSDDIEDISVLKGATASALYGYRGASGAVMITTKSGAKKKGISVSINSSTMFNAGFLAVPEQQSMYGRKLDVGGDTYVRAAAGSWGPPLEGQLIKQWNPTTKQMEEMPFLPIGKNNFMNYLEPGFILNNNINVTQQGEFGGVRASASWMDQKGQYPNSKFDKINYSIGGDMKYKGFTLSSNFMYSKQTSPNRGSNDYRGYDPMYSVLIWASPDWDIRQYKDYWVTKDEVQNSSYTSVANNPYFDRYERRNPFNRDVFNGMLNAGYEFLPGLKISLRSGFDSYSTKQEAIVSQGSFTGMGTLQLIPGGTEIWGETAKGSYNMGLSRGYSINNDLMLTANKTVKDFTIDAMAGGNIYHYQDEGIESRTQGGLSLPGFYSLKASVNPAATQSTLYRRQVNSLYGRLALSWKSMVYAEGTLRNDWSSTLPESTRSYLYPSVSGSFIVSELLPKTDWLSIWKLRSSWTQSKTPAGVYSINNTFNITSNAWGTLSAASYTSTVRGTDVRPETSNTFEIGTLVDFFKKRLSIDASWYSKLYYDYIKSASVSSASGYSSKQLNTEERQMRRGYELTVSGTPVKTRDWQWDLSANWSHYVRTYEKVDSIYTSGVTRDWVYDGARVDAYTYYYYERDPEGNLVHNSSGMPQFQPFVSHRGYGDPDGVWGASSRLRYKNWELGISFDGRIGGMTPAMTENYMWRSGNHPQSLTFERYLDATVGGANYLSKGVKVASGSVQYDATGKVLSDTRVFVPNDVKITYEQYITTMYYSAAWDNSKSAWRPTVQYSTTFFKLREMSLTYQVPSSVTKLLKAQYMSVSAIGQNLFLWAKDFKYTDPDGGSDVFSDPSIRYIGFNVKLNF
jgi:TonB-linked SusC/RagA family outer membrane protein